MEKREVAKLVEAIRDHSAEYVHEDSKVYVDWELGNTALAMDAVIEAFEKWSSALREENARKDELIRWACDKLGPELNPSNYDHQDVCELNSNVVEVVSALDAALASVRPAPAQEEGEDADLREALEDCVAAHDWPTPNCTMGKAIERARALLARKPAEEADRSLDQFQETPRVGKPAEERGPEGVCMFPLQHGNEGDWIIDFDFLLRIQADFQDGEDYGKPSLETIEEVLLVLMRRAEVEARAGSDSIRARLEQEG